MDEEALALFVKDGGRREDWPLVDEAVRLHYRIRASSSDTSKPSGWVNPYIKAKGG